MDHSEAVQKMTAERYLLDELTLDEREEFEEHLFDCPECTLDLRAGAAFVDEAKLQLPELTANSPESAPADSAKPKRKTNYWFLSWRPAFAAVAFASLLVVVGYQNLVLYPALREAANQPRILPWAPMHGDTRGGHLTITADREHGVALPVDLSGAPGSASSYCLDLLNPQGKLQWTGAVTAPGDSEGANHSFSLVIPGAKLGNGLYTIVVSGIGPNGERTAIDRYVFEVRLTD
jgi:hypothetical protein